MRTQIVEVQPWVSEVEKFVLAILSGREVLNATMSFDYAGTDGGSDYLTLAYLIADTPLSGWDKSRTGERTRYQTFDRRLSYKRFRPSTQGPQLDWWLDTTRHISGEIVVIAFSKQMLRGLEPIRPHQDFPFLGKWKPKALEDATRKALVGGMLIAHKLKNGGNLQWITDQDDAVANASIEADFMRMGAIMADMFSPFKQRAVSFGTTARDCRHIFREDFNSVADIAAGMAAELLTAVRRSQNRSHLNLDTITRRCETVASWFWKAPFGPRRLCLVVDQTSTSAPLVSAFEL